MNAQEFTATRLSLGLTKLALAQLLGVSKNTIPAVEASVGQVKPLYALAIGYLELQRSLAAAQASARLFADLAERALNRPHPPELSRPSPGRS